jgi:leucyl-tRNA synthetase
VNSGELNGLYNEEAITKAIELLEANQAGEKKVNYTPVPDGLISSVSGSSKGNSDSGTVDIDPSSQWIIGIPETDEIKPSGTGESPLANIDDFVNVTDEKTGMKVHLFQVVVKVILTQVQLTLIHLPNE